MADETPTAPTPAEGASVADNPTTTNNAQAPAAPTVDLGLTAEQAQKFKTFIDNNGGFDGAFSKLKADISTPKSAQPVEEPKKEEPAQQVQPQPQEPQFKTPEGAITAQEFLAKQYFKALAGEEKYAPIAKGIENGDYLKEMAAFGINALNQDGSINDQKVRMYLDLKAQTVPAKPTGTEPDASAAPTVGYVNVGDKIENIDQAYQVIMQPNHPATKMAEEFIKNYLNPNSEKKS